MAYVILEDRARKAKEQEHLKVNDTNFETKQESGNMPDMHCARNKNRRPIPGGIGYFRSVLPRVYRSRNTHRGHRTSLLSRLLSKFATWHRTVYTCSTWTCGFVSLCWECSVVVTMTDIKDNVHSELFFPVDGEVWLLR